MENNYYYLRKIDGNDDRALFRGYYGRLCRRSFDEPIKSYKLVTVKKLSTILKHRKALHEYCDEWFDIYDQDNNKVEIEGENK